ncbi:hypothetical protein BN946_scf184633.g3 [Trametes cinnabarina]|uniref:Major facilitator superfamily (MFS) profile domain-containing protein n=1 Tax=Pycnoporus cinnabarinus TaxID=5643 RepID=A0A060SSR1_PYCCI|nr:hypothetical protein BN946_scf184633.g3 [Trametes cinnabarina]
MAVPSICTWLGGAASSLTVTISLMQEGMASESSVPSTSRSAVTVVPESPRQHALPQRVHVKDEEDKEVDRTEERMQPTPPSERGFTFWMIFASTLLVEMLSALDLTAVSTALPTIVERLHGSNFIWAGGAYTIASTAVLPLVGGLVSGFGRKWVLISFVFCFAVGSVFCGTATSMKLLIVGRAIQGLGSGGSLSCTEIIFADMVPLPERGKFQGIGAAVWALACAVGPPIGGALAGSGAWRWLFYMNLPLCGLAAIAICIFLRNVAPEGALIDKVCNMDWTASAPQEMSELNLPADYLPVYLQASKDASALHSGVDMFGLSFSIPLFAIFTGVSIEVFNIYRPQNYVGWICTVVGFVLLSLLTPKSGAAEYIGFQIPLGVGVGILWLGTQYPVLAPLPVSDNAYALAFFVFVRNFAQSWGIVVGGAILQNVLTKKLPTSLTSTLPKGRDYAYQIIPKIHEMHEPQKTEVRVAFSEGTQLIWRVMIGLSAAGLLTCLLMREEEMKTEVDEACAVTGQKKEAQGSEDHVAVMSARKQQPPLWLQEYLRKARSMIRRQTIPTMMYGDGKRFVYTSSVENSSKVLNSIPQLLPSSPVEPQPPSTTFQASAIETHGPAAPSPHVHVPPNFQELESQAAATPSIQTTVLENPAVEPEVARAQSELPSVGDVSASTGMPDPGEPLSLERPRTRNLQSSKVPSSRLGRLFHYGGLAASLGYGAASELLRRTTSSADSGSLMLTEGNIKRLVSKLTQMRGAALKLGQFMSIQDSHVLPPEIEDIFRRVQDSAHYMPDWQMEQVMQEALGPSWMDNFESFDRLPFAAASIGQVHSAVLSAAVSPTGSPARVAVKVQFPNIVNSINSDLGYVKMLLTAGKLLPRGLFLDRTIQIAERIIDLCLRELFVFRLMQTDPNWTNFLWNPRTRKVELVDFGATREYSKEFIDNWLHLLSAAVSEDRDACIQWSLKLGYLTGQENEIMLDAHVKSMVLLGTPFKASTPQPFKFGQGSTWADITAEIRAQIPVMLQHRLTPPPRETYSLNRKLSGAFLLASRLNASVDCRTLWQKVVDGYRFG